MSEHVNSDLPTRGFHQPTPSLRLATEQLNDAFGRSDRLAVSKSTLLSNDSVAIVSRTDLVACQKWASAFALERKDHRYYEIVEDTLHPEFEHRYLVLNDRAGTGCAVQPFFILDVDLVEGVSHGIRSFVGHLRRLWPRFMYLRTLMMGCVAGEGHLDGDELSQKYCTQHLAKALLEQARLHKAGLIVLKEFPAKYRPALESLPRHGFTRLPSLPMTSLNIAYSSFNEYMTKVLSRATRKNLRRKFKASERAASIELNIVSDISPFVDEIYPLYLQVYRRSSHHFEKLTPEYLCAVGRSMPDKTRFFVWRQNGSAIAFSMCMVQGDAIYDEYIGLDYSVALDLHLYHYTFRDIVTWGIANGYKWYRSSSLNYDPKLHLRCRLDPLDLYVRHASPPVNTILRLILPWLEPVRYDKNLKRFSNYRELWGDR